MSAFVHFVVAHRRDLWEQAGRHLALTVVALALAVASGLPLGLLLARHPKRAAPVLAFASAVQTIPSLALLGFLIPLTGIGAVPAIVALFVYALVPILRNTITGVAGVDPSVREAAVGMGMTDREALRNVELPLAAPVVFAGVRTAAVVCVGVATLAALVGGGGLGVYIFRGISLASTSMILAGALPSALLALAIDAVLGLVERRFRTLALPFAAIALACALAVLGRGVLAHPRSPVLRIGVPAEFMERPDGYFGMRARYGLSARPVEMDHGLMYRALAEGRIDAAVGYSTDGEIAAFGFTVLADDRHYFPPYFAAPLARRVLLERHPEVRAALERLAGRIDQATMSRLNAAVERDHVPAGEVAASFLAGLGLRLGPHRRTDAADVVIGSKIFAEQYVLAEMFADLVESYTGLGVRLVTGLGGTKICFEALRKGEIDVYPEYTGTGLYAILDASDEVRRGLDEDPARTFGYVRDAFRARFGVEWLEPLGFENRYALIVSRETRLRFGARTMSELASGLGSAR